MPKPLKRILWGLFIVFILLNVLAFIHAYKFTHFSNDTAAKTSADGLTFADKLKLAFTGINNPRPYNKYKPSRPYKVISMQSNKRIECWMMNADSAKGTVAIFHGYSGEKSGMLDKAYEFLDMGYNVMLVDFMGAGGAEGDLVTVGYKEAEEVKTVFDFLKTNQEGRVYLFGTSMGAVSILKAIHDYHINPAAIIIECPFESMYTTTVARFHMMHLPVFPMAGLLVFWGGLQNGFWAFGHKPVDYAKDIKCPTLLMFGEKDDRVSRVEIDHIYNNLDCPKQLKTYPLAGHTNYLIRYKQQWDDNVSSFLKNY